MHHIRFTLDVIEDDGIKNTLVCLSDLYQIIIGALQKDGYEIKEIHSSMFSEPPKILIKKVNNSEEKK